MTGPSRAIDGESGVGLSANVLLVGLIFCGLGFAIGADALDGSGAAFAFVMAGWVGLGPGILIALRTSGPGLLYSPPGYMVLIDQQIWAVWYLVHRFWRPRNSAGSFTKVPSRMPVAAERWSLM